MSDNRAKKGFPLSMRFIAEGRLMPSYLTAKKADERYKQIQRRGEGPLGPLHRPRLGCLAWFAVIVLVNLSIRFLLAPALVSVLPAPVLAALGLIASVFPVGLIPLAAIVYLAWRFDRPLAQRAARETLVENGIEICVGCGYDLRTLPSSVPSCPECGRERIRIEAQTEEARAADA